MVYGFILGALALFGGGWFTSSLVASLAEPVALILAAASGVAVFVQMVRRGYLDEYFSSDEGKFLGAGIIGAGAFYLVFVAAQGLIVSLSPIAGVIVVVLGVSLFVFGPGLLFDLVDILIGGE